MVRNLKSAFLIGTSYCKMANSVKKKKIDDDSDTVVLGYCTSDLGRLLCSIDVVKTRPYPVSKLLCKYISTVIIGLGTKPKGFHTYELLHYT